MNLSFEKFEGYLSYLLGSFIIIITWMVEKTVLSFNSLNKENRQKGVE
jgi:hypothetical protein